MRIVPGWLIDRLPVDLWRPGNLRLGGRLYFCTGGVRTIEWGEPEIDRGHQAIDYAAWNRQWPEDEPEDQASGA